MNITYHHEVLEKSEFTLNAILDIIAEGTWDWHADTGHVFRSPGWYKMLGYDFEVFSPDVFTWENVIHPDDYPKVMEYFELYTSGQIEQYEIEYRCKKADNTYLWIRDRGKIIEYNDDGSVKRMIGAHQDIHLQKTIQNELLKRNQLLEEGNITLEKLLKEKNRELEEKNFELEKKVSEIKYLSEMDMLTEIPNRRKFQIEIEKEVARSQRYGHNLSLVIIDVDFFKNVNDKYGHDTGDFVLQKLASFIKIQLRTNDFIARWGGEEFALLLPSTDINGAKELAEKLREDISQMNFGNQLVISCSFGVTQYCQNNTISQLFTNADIALYKAKELGRNRVECYSNDETCIE